MLCEIVQVDSCVLQEMNDLLVNLFHSFPENWGARLFCRWTVQRFDKSPPLLLYWIFCHIRKAFIFLKYTLGVWYCSGDMSDGELYGNKSHRPENPGYIMIPEGDMRLRNF